jgi:hypothetical protein
MTARFDTIVPFETPARLTSTPADCQPKPVRARWCVTDALVETQHEPISGPSVH